MESDWSNIRNRTSWSPQAFTSRVYEEQMSGKPRMSGARAALAYFHVPDDDGRRLAEFADRKQAMVVRLIEAGDFTAYPDALRFIIAVKDAGIGVAAASSSRNAQLLLGKIRLGTFARGPGITSASLRPGLTLLDFFDADVSGRNFAHGKPDPEMFLTAGQQRLDAAPGHLDDPLWVPTMPPHAACEYSWIRPPSRSRLRTRMLSSAAGAAGIL